MNPATRLVPRPYARFVALLLVVAGLAPVAAPAQSSAEQRLRCESASGGERFCAARIEGSVRLVQSFGSTPCREGSTWRYDSRGVYVRNGCRGEFAWGGSGWGASGNGWNGGIVEVNCASNDGREQFCPADNRGVTLRKQESRAPCIEGQTWRADRRGVYVRNGCRGVFEARQGGGNGWGGGGGWGNGGGGGPPLQVKCQSIGGRWGVCPVDIDGPVRLVKKESRAECVRGMSWGVMRNEGIWVSNGCRAIFEVMNGRAAMGRKAYGGPGDAPPGIERRKEE